MFFQILLLLLWQSSWKEQVYLRVKIAPQIVYFTEKKFHRTVLKQRIRIKYLIKQKPRGALAGNRDAQEGCIEKGDSCHSVFL